MLDLTNLPQDPYKDRHVNTMAEINTRGLLEDHRGRTAGGRFTWRSGIELTGDDFPPDSKYWKGQATMNMEELAGATGRDLFCEWFDLTWPEPTIEKLTWRTISNMVNAAVFAWKYQGERDLSKLAEAAHERLAQLIKENL